MNLEMEEGKPFEKRALALKNFRQASEDINFMREQFKLVRVYFIASQSPLYPYVMFPISTILTLVNETESYKFLLKTISISLIIVLKISCFER